MVKEFNMNNRPKITFVLIPGTGADTSKEPLLCDLSKAANIATANPLPDVVKKNFKLNPKRLEIHNKKLILENYKLKEKINVFKLLLRPINRNKLNDLLEKIDDLTKRSVMSR